MLVEKIKNRLRPWKWAAIRLCRRISAAYNRRRYHEVLVLGDSHVMVFLDRKFKQHFPSKYFHVECVQGATASGLENPNSKTQAYPLFKKALDRFNREDVVVMLGEVDTGFVIWYRSQKYNQSIEQAFEKAVETYASLLGEISKEYNLICISTPLPTIEDGNDWGDIANLRKEVTASQNERTDLTLRFNQEIERHCHELKARYVSLDTESLGVNGIVSKKLLSLNSADHHYNKDVYADMIIDGLKPYITE